MKTETQDEPSREARKVVSELWPNVGEREKILTEWGHKTPLGLANCIDEITSLPKLTRDRAALLAALELCWQATGEAMAGDCRPEKLAAANSAARTALTQAKAVSV